MKSKDNAIEKMMGATVSGSQIVSENIEDQNLSSAELISEMNTLKKQIEKQRRVIHSLKRDAMSDPLTSLANRRVFEKELKRSIAVAKRYNRQSALLMVDVDKFKDVNDTHGHVTGDKVLVFIAKLLAKNTRRNDVVARIGGDEFCVILNEVSCSTDAAERAESLANIIKTTPFKLDNDIAVNISVSVGYQVFGGNAEALTIMQHADSNMYAQKDIAHNL